MNFSSHYAKYQKEKKLYYAHFFEIFQLFISVYIPVFTQLLQHHWPTFKEKDIFKTK